MKNLQRVARPAGLEPATAWFVERCGCLDSRFFVGVARIGSCCYVVFGSKLFTDCSLTKKQREDSWLQWKSSSVSLSDRMVARRMARPLRVGRHSLDLDRAQ